MVLKRLTDFLDQHGVRYVVVQHSQAFTARELATLSHIPARDVAKTLILKVDDKPLMVVLPGSEMVEMTQVRSTLGAASVRLAAETELNTLFPECEIGAMPPFGNLFGLDVLVAESLTRDTEIAFNAGTHHDLIKMPYADFARIVSPRVAAFSVERRAHPNLFDTGLS
jgi:Ala-tRNA(Pro) deacylase